MLLFLSSILYAAPPTIEGESGYPMVKIPAGRFLMGSGKEKDEREHEVVLTHAFFVGVYEVNQKVWNEVRDKNPSKFQSPQQPVSNVSFFDVVLFANALSQKEGLEQCYTVTPQAAVWPKGYQCAGYRLLTEAEWEYAARANQEEDMHESVKDTVAWTKGNAQKQTHPVGQKAPNAFGLYDMVGNVWEWVWDIYEPYSSTEIIDPMGAKKGPFRIRRGGGYSTGTSRVRIADRYALNPINEHSFLGFRLARTAKD